MLEMVFHLGWRVREGKGYHANHVPMDATNAVKLVKSASGNKMRRYGGIFEPRKP